MYKYSKDHHIHKVRTLINHYFTTILPPSTSVEKKEKGGGGGHKLLDRNYQGGAPSQYLCQYRGEGRMFPQPMSSIVFPFSHYTY